MAALGATALEAATAAHLRALGFSFAAGGTAVIANEAAKARAEAAEKAGASPIAQAGAKLKEKIKCKKCPPDNGKPFQRNFAVRKGWVDYQARITGMPNGPTFIMEWEFSGTRFDGFVSADCLLQDAKAGYDQFFDEWGDFKYDFQERIFTEMASDAAKQNKGAFPKPPVQLRWYFQQPVSYSYMQEILQEVAPEIEVVYRP